MELWTFYYTKRDPNGWFCVRLWDLEFWILPCHRLLVQCGNDQCGSGGQSRISLPAAAVLADGWHAAANQCGGALGEKVDEENVALGRSIDTTNSVCFLLRGFLTLLHKWQTSAKATFEKPFKHLTATAMASSELVTFTTLISRWTRISMTMKWYCAASLSFAPFFLFVLWTLTMLSGGRTYKNGRQRRWWPGQLRGVPQNGPWFQQEICRQLNCTMVSQLIALLMRWTPPLLRLFSVAPADHFSPLDPSRQPFVEIFTWFLLFLLLSYCHSLLAWFSLLFCVFRWRHNVFVWQVFSFQISICNRNFCFALMRVYSNVDEVWLCKWRKI